jgi:hypothetical protein
MKSIPELLKELRLALERLGEGRVALVGLESLQQLV